MVETGNRFQDGLVACEYCDLLHRVVTLPPGGKARCSRCGGVFYRNLPNALEHSLAFTLAGLFLYFVANVFPFLRVSLEGQLQTNTIGTGVASILDLLDAQSELLTAELTLTNARYRFLEDLVAAEREISLYAFVEAPADVEALLNELVRVLGLPP